MNSLETSRVEPPLDLAALAAAIVWRCRRFGTLSVGGQCLGEGRRGYRLTNAVGDASPYFLTRGVVLVFERSAHAGLAGTGQAGGADNDRDPHLSARGGCVHAQGRRPAILGVVSTAGDSGRARVARDERSAAAGAVRQRPRHVPAERPRAAGARLQFVRPLGGGLGSGRGKCDQLYEDPACHDASVLKPLPGIFLEFAPIERRYDVPFRQRDAAGAGGLTHGRLLDALDANLAWFGREGAQTLEYWLDLSRFSRLEAGEREAVAMARRRVPR